VNYFRQFDLSAKVDESKIAAELKQGVLTLTLSKVAEAQPRKIAVAVS
jgi:HSP20 family protein